VSQESGKSRCGLRRDEETVGEESMKGDRRESTESGANQPLKASVGGGQRCRARHRTRLANDSRPADDNCWEASGWRGLVGGRSDVRELIGRGSARIREGGMGGR